MGLDINAVRFLIAAKKAGVEFGRVLTLGRQDLNVYPAKLRQVLDANLLPSTAFQPGAPDTLFAEPIFEAVGATQIASLDASDFEGATVVHDLNQPITSRWKEQFDVVYDGGTLEHVFNFPVALRNCMEMLAPGGRLFIHTGVNNWCGHGFYQFSPELFFRALSPENGFEMEQMVLHMVGPYGRWYEVTDPERIRSRVELITFVPVQILLRARRTKAVTPFEKAPQQSDYTPRWRSDQAGPDQPPAVVYGATRSKLSRLLPGVARLLNVLENGLRVYYRMSLRNRRCFRPVPKA
ncbi:MAG: class I SAM-dependent methyltransferase [Verrucomicrobia bacterium]|nr:class I SAM-dependent methyltransferase [Verrucomicrobiota bacterium]